MAVLLFRAANYGVFPDDLSGHYVIERKCSFQADSIKIKSIVRLHQLHRII